MKVSKSRIRQLINESFESFIDNNKKYDVSNSDIVEKIRLNIGLFNKVVESFMERYIKEYIPHSIIMIDNYDPDDHYYDFKDRYGNFYDFNTFAGLELKKILSILYRVILELTGMTLSPTLLKGVFYEIVEYFNTGVTLPVNGRKFLYLDEDSFSFILVGQDFYGLHATDKLYFLIESYVTGEEFDPATVMYHDEK